MGRHPVLQQHEWINLRLFLFKDVLSIYSCLKEVNETSLLTYIPLSWTSEANMQQLVVMGKRIIGICNSEKEMY